MVTVAQKLTSVLAINQVMGTEQEQIATDVVRVFGKYFTALVYLNEGCFIVEDTTDKHYFSNFGAVWNRVNKRYCEALELCDTTSDQHVFKVAELGMFVFPVTATYTINGELNSYQTLKQVLNRLQGVTDHVLF